MHILNTVSSWKLLLAGAALALSLAPHQATAAVLLGQYAFENDNPNNLNIYNSAPTVLATDALNGGSTAASTPVTGNPSTTSAYRSFDGTDYVNQPDYIGGLGAYSLSVWFNTTMAVAGSLVGGNGTYVISMSDNGGGTGRVGTGIGQIRFAQNTESTWDTAIYSTSTTLNNGAWHHVAITYDNTVGTNNILMYIDGVLQTAKSTGVGVITDGADELIGTLTTLHTAKWVGGIDDVRYYSGALTGAEVLGVYNSTASLYNVPEPAPGLLLGALGLGAVFIRRRRQSRAS